MFKSLSGSARKIVDHSYAHPTTYEDVSDFTYATYDQRQEAAYRMIVYLRQKGNDIRTDEQFVEALEEHGSLVTHLLRHTRRDLLRNDLRRFKRHVRYKDAAIATDWSSFLTEGEMASFDVIDPKDEMDAVERRMVAMQQLLELYEEATEAQREALDFMVDLSELKDKGLPHDTDVIRSKLKRLRKKSGWKLATAPL